ncbi:MAG: amino acid ABC transporter substrate-binding protein [Deltaproteobacteria bacterium]|nr:amino acid ABC transporter substrate-binding protein [Deltaproteobacteria bacterium]MBI3078724.1 amino acid ABC transporter substrate-binding protein [Deltaproteobacteria bacterium]
MNDRWRAMGAALVLVFAVLGVHAGPALGQQEIKIGFTMSNTGAFARASKPVLDGILLYRDWVNRQGGIYVKALNRKLPVRLIYFDDETNKDNVLRLYERLAVQERVDFFFAPYSSPLTFTAAAIAAKYKRVMLAHTANAIIIHEQGNPFIVMNIQAAPIWGRAMFEAIKQKDPRATRTVIIYEDTLFAKGVAEFGRKAAQELGFNVVLFDKFPFAAPDVSPVLTKVRTAAPDVLMWMAHEESTILGLRQMKELDVNAKAIAVLDPGLYLFYKALGPKDLEGVSGLIEWDPGVTYPVNYGPKNDEFLKLYYEKHPGAEPPDNHTPMGFAVGLVLQAAIEKTGTLDSVQVRAAMNDLNITTLIGPFKIDPKTGLQQGYVMLATQWQKGKSVVIWPPKYGYPDQFVFPMPRWRDKR